MSHRIVLLKGKAQDTYEVKEENDIQQALNQFYGYQSPQTIRTIYGSENIIDKHFLINIQNTTYWPKSRGYSDLITKVIGIAHDKEELPDKVYQCAKRFAETLAKINGAEFIDLTSRAVKEGQLEKSAQSQLAATSSQC